MRQVMPIGTVPLGGFMGITSLMACPLLGIHRYVLIDPHPSAKEGKSPTEGRGSMHLLLSPWFLTTTPFAPFGRALRQLRETMALTSCGRQWFLKPTSYSSKGGF